MSQQLEMGLVKLLGIRVVEAGPDRVRLAWDVTPDHHQPYGIVHGGVHCTAIEAAASIGAALWYGERGRVVGVANQTDFLHAVRDGALTAEARPIHRGRSQQLWLVEVADSDGRVVARGQVRLHNLRAESHSPPDTP